MIICSKDSSKKGIIVQKILELVLYSEILVVLLVYWSWDCVIKNRLFYFVYMEFTWWHLNEIFNRLEKDSNAFDFKYHLSSNVSINKLKYPY